MRIAARDDYDELHGGFRWLVPERFNIAQACCTRWAGNARRTAIVVDHGDGRVERVGYRRIHEDAERLASAVNRPMIRLTSKADAEIATVISQPCTNF